MARKGPPRDTQFELFVPYLSDLALRDQREIMERPFFSLSKRKRLKPIDYVSPDGSVWVKVEPHQAFGMATIWDADLLIWCASQLTEHIERARRTGSNEPPPRKLRFQPYDLLRAIRRGVSGREYQLLKASLDRLTHTAIRTNIRAKGRKKEASFHWLDAWTDEVDEASGVSRGMTVTLSDWFYEGVIQEGGVLAIHPDYFLLTGALERWLYRVARKHGGRQSAGFAISVETLYAKSGAEEPFRNFKVRLKRIVQADDLPEYHLDWIEPTENGGVAVHMTARSVLDPTHPAYRWSGKDKRRPAPAECI